MDFTRIKYLLNRYHNGELTKEEWHEFRTMLADDNFLPALSDDMRATFSSMRQKENWSRKIASSPDERPNFSTAGERRLVSLHFKKYHLWYAAAAVIIISLGVFWIESNIKKDQTVATVKMPEASKPAHDRAPATDRAVLTLSDGSTIILDSASSGTLAKEGSSEVRKLQNGEIVYAPVRGNNEQKILFNTMTTPRGGRFSVVLPDGSHVWLNAASSITYPTAFNGKERVVNITGEVYFEVARDMKKPFVVKTIRETITVLGTHFNVNAYADEPSVKTSLVEGKVMVEKRLLMPGQAFVNGKVMATNITQDVAWKSGVFDFDDVEFAAGLRQLARWYDLEIQYHTDVPKTRFGGKIDRDLTLSQVLKVIDGVGAHFELEGRVLHVTK